MLSLVVNTPETTNTYTFNNLVDCLDTAEHVKGDILTKDEYMILISFNVAQLDGYDMRIERV